MTTIIRTEDMKKLNKLSKELKYISLAIQDNDLIRVSKDLHYILKEYQQKKHTKTPTQNHTSRITLAKDIQMTKAKINSLLEKDKTPEVIKLKKTLLKTLAEKKSEYFGKYGHERPKITLSQFDYFIVNRWINSKLQNNTFV